MKRTLMMWGLMATILTTGCSSTKQSKDLGFSGFLEDYTILEETRGKYVARLRWVKPDVDWASYDKILLEQVEVWRNPDAKQKGMSREDLQVMANRFYAELYESLDRDYEMVQGPEPGALRLEVALCSIGAGKETLDVVSTVMPPMIAASAVTELTTGKPAFVGEGTMEFRITDAVTGEMLAAGVDRRVGGKRLGKEYDKWADVKAILKAWCSLARYRLCVLRGDTDCPKPTGL